MELPLVLIVGCFGIVRSCRDVEWIVQSSVKWTLGGQERVSDVSKTLLQCFIACQPSEGCAGFMKNSLCKKLKSLVAAEQVVQEKVIPLQKDVAIHKKDFTTYTNVTGLTVSKQVLFGGASTLTPMTNKTETRSSLSVKKETEKIVPNRQKNNGPSLFHKLREITHIKKKLFTLTQRNDLFMFDSTKKRFVRTGFQLKKLGEIQRIAFDIRRSITFYTRTRRYSEHLFQHRLTDHHQKLPVKGKTMNFQVVAEYQFLVIMSLTRPGGKLLTYNYNSRKVVPWLVERSYTDGNIIVSSKEKVVYFASLEHLTGTYNLKKVKFTAAGERESVGIEKIPFGIFWPHFDIFGGNFYLFSKRRLMIMKKVSKVQRMIKLPQGQGIQCHAGMATEKTLFVFCPGNGCPRFNIMCDIYIYTIDGKHPRRMKRPVGMRGPVFRI